MPGCSREIIAIRDALCSNNGVSNWLPCRRDRLAHRAPVLSNFRAEHKNVLNDRGAELYRRAATILVLAPIILSPVSIFPRH
ncbi:hypothetical protein PUN28_003185 [Cardiocondyla obscurior]|uniref:Uncharacterized protein n=1 Tax=Cardiocondyla obscurior TaxID=286306 RepID=A0AAW2GKR7_9HYME